MANTGKEKKNKEGREDNSVLLRRLLDEVSTLQNEVQSIKAEKTGKATYVSGKEVSTGENDSLVTLTTDTLNPVTEADETAVARLAYAFSSAQKVKIVRILFHEGPLSSAQIGERAGLTTGSLYHHLRELTHSEVIEPAGRSQHTLTALGKRTTLILFAQIR